MQGLGFRGLGFRKLQVGSLGHIGVYKASIRYIDLL